MREVWKGFHRKSSQNMEEYMGGRERNNEREIERKSERVERERMSENREKE